MGLTARKSHFASFFLLVILCSACNTLFKEEPRPAPVSKMTGIEITAGELHQAFVDNQVSGDQRFKGRVIAVSGTIHSIMKYGDQPVVNLPVQNSSGGVQCYFESEQATAVARLKRGQQVTVKCRCDQFFDNVVLAKECILP